MYNLHGNTCWEIYGTPREAYCVAIFLSLNWKYKHKQKKILNDVDLTESCWFPLGVGT